MIVHEYKPISPTIEAFHNCDAQAKCIVGPVGTGKTTAAIWEIGFNLPRRIYMDYGIDHTRWVVVRKTFEQLMDTDFQEAMDWFTHGQWQASKKRLTCKWPASKNCPSALIVELIFHSCNTPEEEGKFRSMNLTGAWIDEANQLSVVVKNIIKGRLGRYPKIKDTPVEFTPRYFIETSNPFPADHPMYTTYDWMGPKVVKRALPQLKCRECDKLFSVAFDEPICPSCGGRGERTGDVDWRSGEYDTDVVVHKLPRGPVPAGQPTKNHIGFWQEPTENEENLRPGYWQAIADDYKEAPEMIRVLIGGKAGMQPKGKPVYRNFVPEIHVAQGPLRWSEARDNYTGEMVGVPLICGWDMSGDWPAMVLGQRVAPMQFQILREFFDERMGIIDFGKWVAESLQQDFAGAAIAHWGDPAGFAEFSDRNGGLTSNATLLYEQCGIRIQKSRQELDLRISAVDQLLIRRDGILIDPRCILLVNGFTAGYVREENPRLGQREYKTDPMKNRYSHIHDALQYMLVTSIYPLIKEPREDVKQAEKLTAQMTRFSDGSAIHWPRETVSTKRRYDPRRV